jgi:hypothetical protein
MKLLLTTLVFFLAFTKIFGQSAKVTWGDEFKLKKGSTDLEVIKADNSGIFVKESHLAVKSYFVIGGTTRESATLIKLDKSLNEVYSSNFNKELKGKEYEKFLFVKDKLFLIASDYNKKDKTLVLYAAELDKNTGDIKNDWQEIASIEKDSKKEDILTNVSLNEDSTKMVISSSIEGREKNTYQITLVNDKLKAEKKSALITNEFEKGTYDVESIIYTTNGNILIVAREYEYREGKKKKAKFLDFKNYNMRLYSGEGKIVNEINTTINGKWLISAAVRQINGTEIALAAFYSNEKKSKETNGMLVQRINALTGTVINTSDKLINTSMLNNIDATEDDDEEESKKEKKEREKLEKIKDDEDAFSRNLRFRNIINTPDNGLLIIAEEYNSYTYTTTTYNSGGVGGFGSRNTTTTYKVYECGNIFFSKVDKNATINWLNIVPKNQYESILLGRSSGPGTGLSFHHYFDPGANWPFYSGFGVVTKGNNVVILFNDHKKNDGVLQLGQKVKRVTRFNKSLTYSISIDVLTGKYTRTSLYGNEEVTTSMPRLGMAFGSDFYIIGKEDKFLSKTRIAVGRLTLK